MGALAPLQLLVFRYGGDETTKAFEDAIVRAFQGGKDAGGYLATGEDLRIEMKLFDRCPALRCEELLDGCCHTLTVVLADDELLKADDALWNWLEECASETKKSSGRHAMLFLAMDEGVQRQSGAKRPGLQVFQSAVAARFGEFAIRPANFALFVLHRSRVLLAESLPAFAGQARKGYLRLFISHAKLDGLPLAQALKSQIESLKWLEDFYDADDLPPGCDWQKELEIGVGTSLIVILRTEIYDSRSWCRQEVFWADEYATPAVLVDARTNLDHPAAVIPLDRIPSVRIPDGNLMRILFAALREGLRFLHFMRRVEEMKKSGIVPSSRELRVFSYAPGMAALLRVCRSLAASANGAGMILYPDPPLRTGMYEAAQALVAAYAPGTQLLTPSGLAATGQTP